MKIWWKMPMHSTVQKNGYYKISKCVKPCEWAKNKSRDFNKEHDSTSSTLQVRNRGLYMLMCHWGWEDNPYWNVQCLMNHCTVNDHKPCAYGCTEPRKNSGREVYGKKGNIVAVLNSASHLSPTGCRQNKRTWKKAAIIEEARAEVIKVMIQNVLFLLKAAGEAMYPFS